MRLYGLTSIITNEVKSFPNKKRKLCPEISYENFEIDPYQSDDEDEITKFMQNEDNTAHSILQAKTRYGLDFQLTEICIGWKMVKVNGHNKEIKAYFMNFYRKDTKLWTFPMLKGTVKIHKISDADYALELQILTSKIFPEILNFDIFVDFRCIRNTATRGKVTLEEEKYYDDYASKINSFRGGNGLKHFPFKLDGTKSEKPQKQRIKDFETVIDLLCNSESGSFKNIPPPEMVLNPKTNKYFTKLCRFDQELDCLMQETEIWSLKDERKGTLGTREAAYQGCTKINWKNVNLNERNLDGIDLSNLKVFRLINTKAFINGFELHPNLTKINFKIGTLKELHLENCNLIKFDDNFISKLSPNLKLLNLSKNDLTVMSSEISKLSNLKGLYLNENPNLSDNGIPWGSLSETLVFLSFINISITKIPCEISKLGHLKKLYVNSEKLQFIDWKNISNTITDLEIIGGNAEIDNPELENKELIKIFSLRYLKITNFDCAKLSPTIKALVLSNNEMEEFLNIQVLNKLEELILYDNCLELISWHHMPSVLKFIDISKNNLQEIGDISNLRRLKELVLEDNQIEEIFPNIFELRNLKELVLSGNKITKLPVGFERFRNLKLLCLDKNEFNDDNDDQCLDEALWNRLPKSLRFLNLSNNNILKQLPCILRNLNLQSLYVNDCSLKYICPYLYTHSLKLDNEMVLSILSNPDLQSLPFIPTKIFQPPKATEKAENFNNEILEFTVKSDNLNFRDTSNFKTEKKRPIYDFKVTEDEGNIICNCCACCGESTNEQIIEQSMAMDFDIVFYKSAPSTASATVPSKSNDSKPKNLTSKKFSKGKWKSNIKTRLCLNCKNALLKKIDNAFDEFQLEQLMTSSSLKRRKLNSEGQNDESEEDELQKYYKAEAEKSETTGENRFRRIITIPPKLRGPSGARQILTEPIFPDPTIDANLLAPNVPQKRKRFQDEDEDGQKRITIQSQITEEIEKLKISNLEFGRKGPKKRTMGEIVKNAKFIQIPVAALEGFQQPQSEVPQNINQANVQSPNLAAEENLHIEHNNEPFYNPTAIYSTQIQENFNNSNIYNPPQNLQFFPSEIIEQPNSFIANTVHEPFSDYSQPLQTPHPSVYIQPQTFTQLQPSQFSHQQVEQEYYYPTGYHEYANQYPVNTRNVPSYEQQHHNWSRMHPLFQQSQTETTNTVPQSHYSNQQQYMPNAYLYNSSTTSSMVNFPSEQHHDQYYSSQQNQPQFNYTDLHSQQPVLTNPNQAFEESSLSSSTNTNHLTPL